MRFSHPLWLCQWLMEEHGYDFAEALLRENNREPVRTLTANLCRITPADLEKQLTEAGHPARVSPLSWVSVLAENGGDVTALPGYREGEFFVQDAGAALSVISAGPEAGMRILDACAAPGGKSFLCASLMRDRGEILACDLHEKKLSRICQGAARLGFSSIRTAAMDAARPKDDLAGCFDIVLADVPCSGLGVIRRKPGDPLPGPGGPGPVAGGAALYFAGVGRLRKTGRSAGVLYLHHSAGGERRGAESISGG